MKNIITGHWIYNVIKNCVFLSPLYTLLRFLFADQQEPLSRRGSSSSSRRRHGHRSSASPASPTTSSSTPSSPTVHSPATPMTRNGSREDGPTRIGELRGSDAVSRRGVNK